MNSVGSLVAVAVASVTWSSALADTPLRDPELLAHDYARDATDSKSRALTIRALDVDVKITGDVARTRITATFSNPGPRVLEGDFVYDLPDKAVVTGYGLDVNGKLMDGVLVARRQATLVYQAKVRQGLDPGLAEITREHAFRTHVYPILQGKERTIRLEFVSPFDRTSGFSLPFEVPESVDAVSFHISSDGKGVPQQVSVPGMNLQWERADFGWDAKGSARKTTLHGNLSVVPDSSPPVLIEKQSTGEIFAELSGTVERAEASAPSRIRVYWDTSLSRRRSNLAAETELLQKYVDSAKPRFVDLVTYSDGQPTTVTLSGDQMGELRQKLGALTYLGATSLAPVRSAKLPRADRCLMFTDGNLTIDSYSAAALSCQASIVSSAMDANRALLETLARRSGGSYYDLRQQSAGAVAAELLRAPSRVAQVLDASGHPLDFAALADGSKFRVIVPVVTAGEVRVSLSDGSEKPYRVEFEHAVASDDLGSLWASGHGAEIEATDRPDRDAMLALARKFSIATPDIDFLVLESVSDYVTAQIEPPKSFGPNFREEYKKEVADRSRRDASDRSRHLDEVVAAWSEEKIWWQTKFPERAKAPEKQAQRGQDRAIPPPPPPPPAPSVATSSSPIQTVVVTGELAHNAEQTEIDIAVQPWDPNRPYIKALKGTLPAAFWSIFGREQASYGDQPSFYIDMAEYSFRQGRVSDAIELALSALEVANDDTTTLHVIADHLMRYGMSDRALWLYERCLYLDQDRPQPYRSLALALASLADRAARTPAAVAKRRAEYSRALELLNEVVTRVWPDEFRGIEVVALMEANRVVPKVRALGVTSVPLDKRLNALLDVDLRIVLEWNTDKTDMDLWVDEPTGERAIYNHPRTVIGGRLSHDMTQGYGPEEYLLHHALDGAYTIRVNVYATDTLNRNGATIVRAHLFRNYGRRGEQERTYEIELGPQEKREGAHIVGTVLVGAK